MKKIILALFLFVIGSYLFADNYTYIKGPMLVKSSSVIANTATTTLTSSSNMVQVFAGLVPQTVVLPVISTLVTGVNFEIQNISTDYVTVRDSSLNFIQKLNPSSTMRFDVVAGNWNYFPSQGKILISDAPISITQDSSTATFSMAKSSSTTDGYLGATDFVNFLSKMPGTATLGQINDVSVDGATEGQVLTYNSSTLKWQATSPSAAAGGGTFIYPWSSSSTVHSTYNQIFYVPQPASETSVTATVSAATSPVLMKTYLFDSPYGDTTLTGGQWSFDFWNLIDSGTGISNLRFSVFARTSTGTETTLFSVDSEDINGVPLIEYVTTTIQPSFTINATDYIGVKVYAVTNTAGTRTISYTIGGTSHYSKWGVPLIIRHNDLRAIQGGGTNDRQHLTTTQLGLVNNAVQGSGAGVANTVAKWNSTSSLTTSSITDDGLTVSTTATISAPKLKSTAQGVYFTVGTSTASSTTPAVGSIALVARSDNNFYVKTSTGTEYLLTSTQKLPPTIQKFTSGTGTYTTPSNPSPTYLKVRMVGGGGGGQGGGTGGAPARAGTGGDTLFGSSLLVANGGTGGGYASAFSGGSASISLPAYGTAINGAGTTSGQNSVGATQFPEPGVGASSFFGGAGGANIASAGLGASANSGSGGGGGSSASAANSIAGAGGAAGGYVEAYVYSPSSSYPYSVGAAGTAGAAGTNGFTGGSGGAGYIEITEYY